MNLKDPIKFNYGSQKAHAAIHTEGDLSVGQIQAMTSGDGSSMAMNNNINSYGWTQHPGTFTAS